MIIRFFGNQACRSKQFSAARQGVSRSIAAANAASDFTATATATTTVPSQHQHQQRRSKHTTVALQLDYYMSPQFAGIACALTEGLYEKAGIDTVKFLSICPVGLEMERVRQFRDISKDDDDDNNNSSSSDIDIDDIMVVVGSVEQNVFMPLLLKNPDLKLKAVAAMFKTSPLCLTSIDAGDGGGDSSSDDLQVVGAHEDTVDLLKRIMIYDNYDKKDPNNYKVIASPRATKITDLLEGKLDFIQAYTTTEVPTLEKHVENEGGAATDVTTIPLEGFNGAKLGYSQMLFAPEEDNEDKREILEAFLEATFEGWNMAINDVEHGARSVEEAKKMLKLNDEHNDHWDHRDLLKYNIHSTEACCDLVKDTTKQGDGDRLGVIDPKRWDEATKWLLNEDVPSGFGLDSTVWQAKK